VIELPVKSSTEWVKINAGQSGFYRVHYSPELSKRLANALKSNLLTSVDRLGLVNDVFALAFSGTVPLSEALDLASRYEEETDPGVWGILIDNLSKVSKLYKSEVPQLNKYILQLFSKIATSIGWDPKEGESDLWKQTRSRVLSILGDHGDMEIHSEAKKRMASFENDQTSVSLELIPVVFKFWLKTGGSEAGKRIVEIYEKFSVSTSVSPEWVVKSLACIGFSSEIHDVLKYILESDKVRGQDFMYPLGSCCSTAEGRDITWKFIQAHWEKVNQKVSASLLSHTITAVTGFYTPEKLKEVEEFFATRTTSEIERTVKNITESIKTNVSTYTLQKENVVAYFSGK